MNGSTRKAQFALLVMFSAAFVVAAGGCRKEEAPDTNSTADTVKVLTATEKAELVRKLAKADAVDGKTDKVVSKCAMCALHMDGNVKHEFELEGYKLHFCSAACLDRCKKDPAEALLALKIPEE